MPGWLPAKHMRHWWLLHVTLHCRANVVGFLNEYSPDGYQNGLFKYQNPSTNSPWNTMSVQISIL